MASRCISFHRAFLLILNWNSSFGAEIFRIWSSSVMKYLALVSRWTGFNLSQSLLPQFLQISGEYRLRREVRSAENEHCGECSLTMTKE